MDFYRGTLSLRKLCVLVEALPPDCTLYRKLAPEQTGWDIKTHILAGIFDGLQAGNWQRGGDSRTPKPEPWPRPYDIVARKAHDRRKDEILEKKIAEWRERKASAATRKELTT